VTRQAILKPSEGNRHELTERRLADLERRTRLTFARIAGPPSVQQLFLIFANGQTVGGVAGIKFLADIPASAPLYDPETDTAYADGLGNAELWDAEQGRVGKVLVCNYNPMHQLFCPLGARFRTFRTVGIPVTGDLTTLQTFYLPWGY
jgi:hypothetical protein